MEKKTEQLNKYWAERKERELSKISAKTEKEIHKQLIKYYRSMFKRVVLDFEAVYDKIVAKKSEGKEILASDLYSLDRYWQLQGQLKLLCEELGEKEIALLSQKFEEQWNSVYEAAALPSDVAFSTLSTSNAHTAIQTIWAADGKSWSSRVWTHTEELAATLNEQLIHVVTTGRSSRDLKRLLQERFNVTYSRANTLVRTEIARIQTESAAKRYMDAGLEEYEILGREEDSCKKNGGHGIDCHKMHGKRFKYSEMKIGTNCPPFHPNCRCSIVPVTKSSILTRRLEEVKREEAQKRAEEAQKKENQKLAKEMKG